MPTGETKKCSGCLEEKPIEEFNKDLRYKDNLNKRCMDCEAKWRKVHNKKIVRKKKPGHDPHYQTPDGKFKKGNPGGPGRPRVVTDLQKLIQEGGGLGLAYDAAERILANPKDYAAKDVLAAANWMSSNGAIKPKAIVEQHNYDHKEKEVTDEVDKLIEELMHADDEGDAS